jgi:hypothetical protein
LPQNIIGDSTNFAPNVRAPTDSDPANTSQLTVAFTDVADRTASLKGRLDALLPGPGTVNIRRLASVGALSLLTPRNDGDLCFVDGLGLYQFSAASIAPNIGNWAIFPSTGGGRWLLLPAQANSPIGFPILDNAGRVSPGQPRNGIVTFGSVNSGGSPGTTLHTVTSTTDVDVNGTTLNLGGGFPGDMVFAMATFMCGVVAGTTGRATLAVVDDSTTAAVHQIELDPVNNQVTVGYAMSGMYTLSASSSGAPTVKLRAARIGGSTSVVFTNQAVVTAFILRP